MSARFAITRLTNANNVWSWLLFSLRRGRFAAKGRAGIKTELKGRGRKATYSELSSQLWYCIKTYGYKYLRKFYASSRTLEARSPSQARCVTTVLIPLILFCFVHFGDALQTGCSFCFIYRFSKINGNKGPCPRCFSDYSNVDPVWFRRCVHVF